MIRDLHEGLVYMKNTGLNKVSNLLLNKIKRLLGFHSIDNIPFETIIENIIHYYENIIGCMPGNVYWMNSEGFAAGCNQNVLDMFKLTSLSQFEGLSFEEMGKIGQWSDEAVQAFKKDTFDVVHTGKPKLNIEEVPIPDKNGQLIYFLTHRVPLIDKQKKVIGVVGISIDITERKKMETDLHQSMLKAESANHSKTEFIANMSHDIRTPLTGVVGMSKMLEDSVTDIKQKNYAHMLGESGDQLLHMLNGILDVVSADNVNENDLHEEPFSLNRMVQDIIELERPTTLVKGLDLIATLDETIPPCVLSDHTKLHRILLNLLGNAIKFTKAGHVDIGAKLLKRDAEHALVQFHVKDTGIGIPYELQDKVFDRFFRVTPSYKGIYTGHGVGLHIAQSYAHLLGGNILLTSEPNVGTTFYFDLSLRIGDAALLPISNTTLASNVVKPEPTSPIPNPIIEKQLNTNATALPLLADAPVLLLVEDNAIALMILENLVTESGFNSMRAADGIEALTLATTHHFDLIITDLGLPGLSGIEFTQKLRVYEHDNQKPLIPIIGLTAHADVTVKNECVQAGMNEAYTKPLTADALKNIQSVYLIKDYVAPIEPQAPVLEENIEGLGADLPETEAQLFELNSTPLLDAKAALSLLNNNVTLFNTTLSSIVEKELPQDLAEIELAHTKGDWTSVEHIAHRMKGGFVCCGIARLALACQYLERYHKAGHTTHSEALYQQLIEVSNKTVTTIKRWLAMQ